MNHLLAFIDLSQFSQSDLILVGVGAVIVIFILFKVAKTLVRVLLFAALALALYFIWTGKTPNAVLKPTLKTVLKNKNIETLHAKFCTPEKENKAICACVVQPLYSDVMGRNNQTNFQNFTDEQKLEQTMMAFENQKEFINTCLKEKKEDNLKIIDILKEQLNK